MRRGTESVCVCVGPGGGNRYYFTENTEKTDLQQATGLEPEMRESGSKWRVF